MNIRKVGTPSEDMITAFSKFNNVISYPDYLDFYHLHKCLFSRETPSAVMQSEKIALCEIHACLWVKAANSAANSLTKHTFTHYIIVQKFINYLLNADTTESFGVVENFLWKLLITHPPSPEMFDYYWQILFDNFICLDGKETEDQILFFCLLETITNCLKHKLNPDGNIDVEESATRYKSTAKKELNLIGLDIQSLCIDAGESFSSILNKSSETNINQKQIYFDMLPWKEKIKRCFLVLKFVLSILETDFIFWLHSKEYEPTADINRPFISHLLWKNQRDIGLMNKEIQKIFQLYKVSMSLDKQNIHVMDKLVTLTAEIIRISDGNEEIEYPFVGMNTANFVRELSLILHHLLLEIKNCNEESDLFINFKLPWLRLLLYSQLLTLITKHPCVPELTGVCNILEYIVNMENQNSIFGKSQMESLESENLPSSNKGKLKNVNSKMKNGKTQLHQACENNEVENIKALLTYPELDVNAVDRDGWTALHLAAYKGKTNSVQELLSFCPKPGGIQKPANTRAKGPQDTTPIMCAASKGYAKICKLLLEHSGSILLEDVNEFNQTAWELANALGVRKIFRTYKSKDVCAKNNSGGIDFDLKLKKVVIKLCVEMIQAYFSTYKTRLIYRTLKELEKDEGDNLTAFGDRFKWDYKRYDTDININIIKLKSLLPKLESIEEFKSLSDIYKTLISLNKTLKNNQNEADNNKRYK